MKATTAGKHRVAVRYSNDTHLGPTATHRVTVNGNALESGEALKVAGPSGIVLESAHDAEVLVFDLNK